MPRKLTTEEFIEKSRLVHGDKFDYSKVEYKNKDSKVVIICKIHGEFKQFPQSHYNGCGCQKCYNDRRGNLRNNTEDIVERFKQLHGDTYDYSNVIYKGYHKNVTIVCNEHGEFKQTPANHLNKMSNGRGCKYCANNVNFTTEQFISKAMKVHKNKYDYSRSNYINLDTDVVIICKKHGEFNQTPYRHINRQHGCESCSNGRNYSLKQIEWFKNIMKNEGVFIRHKLNEGEFVIPGTKYKADGYCEETNTIYEFHGDFWHGNPKKFNQEDINPKTKCTYGELYEKTLLKEQMIKDLGYNLVVLWESDFCS